jgi:hypothetical protein
MMPIVDAMHQMIKWVHCPVVVMLRRFPNVWFAAASLSPSTDRFGSSSVGRELAITDSSAS